MLLLHQYSFNNLNVRIFQALNFSSLKQVGFSENIFFLVRQLNGQNSSQINKIARL